MEQIKQFFSGPQITLAGQALGILILGVILSKILTRLLARFLLAPLGRPSLIIEKLLFYFLVSITAIMALGHLGIDLKVLLGAAGVFTVAIGFASQTSASNLISGIFLMVERPFVEGDLIQIGETQGMVLSIDLLSTRLRTFDNLMVRIPNETLMKGQIINSTFFPIRRIDMKLAVAYKEDMPKVQSLLMELADKNALCLDEPPPLFIIEGFGEYAINIQFSVWVKRDNFLKVKNTLYDKIKNAFDGADIEIPYPHRTVMTKVDPDSFPRSTPDSD